jgi:NAD(P)-dependent dehydrogenase (short-subunit alcohol dehydrogenase family)
VKHKILATVIVIAAGGITYHIIKRSTRSRKKRRGKRAGNGARLEVVVVAGSPSEPLTRSISMDLERRGFIVYVVCNSIEEEVLVQNESRPDIKPLMVDIVDVSGFFSSNHQSSTNIYQTESARASIERFTAHLQTPHAAFQGAKAHHLIFRSLILIPSQTYPSAPISTLAPSTLSDLLNTRLLTPVLTVQSFLPLLHSAPLSHPQHHSAPAPPKPSVLVLTPSIIANLSPAFHLPESTIVSGLTAFTDVLSAELAPLGIPVTHLELGSFDLNSFLPHGRHPQTVQSQRAETLKWDDSSRQAYGKNFVTLSSGRALGNSGAGRGSSLRELNDAVFDAMVKGRGGTVRVGAGSGIYGFVGKWVPRGLVAWMMGLRKVGGEEREVEFGRLIEDGSRSRSTSSGNSESAGDQIHISGLGIDEGEYIPVYGDH